MSGGFVQAILQREGFCDPASTVTVTAPIRSSGVRAGGVQIRDANSADWPAIWAFMEPIVRDGETFSWDRDLDEDDARRAWMRSAPAVTLVAHEPDGRIVGTAELARNHGGGAAHVANAGFMVDGARAGRGVGRMLGEAVIARARTAGFRGLQFNAVVATNERAVSLWRSLGFVILATVPEGFHHPTHGYVGLHIMYRAL